MDLSDIMAEAIRPQPRLKLSDWAERRRRLTSREAAEPGPWRNERTPYLREIMDCLSVEHPARTVVFMAGAQVGKTEIGLNFLGYIIDQGLGNTMAVQPTLSLAQRWSTQRLSSMIDQSSLEIMDSKIAGGSNTMLLKVFNSGVLIITGANSAVGLRSMPAKYLFLDEISGYPASAGEEGDPVSLAERRTATFRAAKIFKCSTPKLEGSCRITTAFQETDQRYYQVPCPLCGAFQVLVEPRIQWPKGQHDLAMYVCEHCEEGIASRWKTWMLEHGKWVPTVADPDLQPGFHLAGLYSPWLTWADIAHEKHRAKEGGDETLQVFVNAVEGRPWRVQGDAMSWRSLYERRENYPIGTLPDQTAAFVTAGVDVQRYGLHVEVVAWAADKQSWSLDYRVLPGDPDADMVWDALSELLERQFVHEESGMTLPIGCMAVDSGYAASKVYNFCRRFSPRRVIAVKGQQLEAPLGMPKRLEITGRGERRKRTSALVWPVGVDFLKAELYGLLKRPKPTDEELADGGRFPNGYCHFPMYQEQFFQEITAEQLVQIVRRQTRRTDHIWQLIPGRRNEALDCRNYARAAASHLGLDNLVQRQINAPDEAARAADREAKAREAAKAESERRIAELRAGRDQPPPPFDLQPIKPAPKVKTRRPAFRMRQMF